MITSLRNFWQLYKTSGWIPLLTSLALIMVPSLFLQIIFSRLAMSNTSSGYFDAVSIFLIGVPWFLALISIITMVLAGIYQLKNGMRVKGIINVLLAAGFILLFIIPLSLFLISPPGVGNG